MKKSTAAGLVAAAVVSAVLWAAIVYAWTEMYPPDTTNEGPWDENYPWE